MLVLRTTRVRRWRPALLGVMTTGAAALALVTMAAPAQALGVNTWSAHGTPAAAPHARSSVAHSSVAPLNEVIIDVTDLSTDTSTVNEWANPTATYDSTKSNCNEGATSPLCISFGDGPGTADGGSFLLLESQLQAGTVYDPTLTANVSADGMTCGTGTGAAPGEDASMSAELDQFVVTTGSQPIQTVGVQFDCTNASVDISGTIAYNLTPSTPGQGYYLYGQQGEITGFGNDNYLDYLDGAFDYNLNAPIVGMAATPTGAGYWMVGGDGGVFASGDAGFYGSTGGLHLNKPVVGMAATPDGKGYWFVASDGGIFSYGDAGFYGSTGSLHLNKPIVGMAATPDGKGYWLVASDGGIFSYGDAGFYGSTGSIHLNQPVVGMTSTPDGKGYWFVAADGGIFSYGDAGFYGSTGSLKLNEPIVGMDTSPTGRGYWFVASDGGIFSYGDAGFSGSLGGTGVTDVAGISNGI